MPVYMPVRFGLSKREKSPKRCHDPGQPCRFGHRLNTALPRGGLTKIGRRPPSATVWQWVEQSIMPDGGLGRIATRLAAERGL